MKLRLALRSKNKGTSRSPLRARVTPTLIRAEKEIAAKMAETVQKTGTTLTVKVKRPMSSDESRALGVAKDGSLKGVHNRLNPPSSEHMRKVRAMRQFYGKQMPVPQCSTCAFSANCPQFKAGHECAFKPFLQSHKVDSVADLAFYMKELLGANIQRLHLATIFERLTGGTPSSELSESFAMLFQQLTQLHKMETESKEVNTEISVTTGDTSLIAKLFGGTNALIAATEQQTRDIQTDLVDVPVEDGPQKALEGVKPSINGDLLDEYERSQDKGDAEAAPAPKPAKTVKGVSPVLQVSDLKVT